MRTGPHQGIRSVDRTTDFVMNVIARATPLIGL
jgi:hypothetical protein